MPSGDHLYYVIAVGANLSAGGRFSCLSVGTILSDNLFWMLLIISEGELLYLLDNPEDNQTCSPRVGLDDGE